MKPPRKIVNTDTLARHCKISPRRIRELTQAGMPKIGRNKFEFFAAMGWYIQFLRAALENKGVQTGDGTLELFRSQKARSLNASAALKELEFAKKRSEVVTVAEAEAVKAELARIIRARIMTIPPRIAPELLGQSSRTMIQAILEKHINETLSLLAKDKPESSSASSIVGRKTPN